jgi:hypothetical protein
MHAQTSLPNRLVKLLGKRAVIMPTRCTKELSSSIANLEHRVLELEYMLKELAMCVCIVA